MQNKYVAIPIALVAVTLLSGAFLMSSYSFAEDSTVDNVNITVPVSCSIEGTGMNTHNANIINGTYQADIGTTTMKAYCNDSEGFAIYANGYTGNTLGNNKLIGSSTASEIVTGTNTSGNTSNWAMKLVAGTGTYPLTLDNGFGSYSSVPASYAKVAHRDSGTDLGTSAEGATLTSTYAAYISKTQPADTYVGQVIYTLVHPASEEPAQPVACEAWKICYQPNSSSVVGEMGKQSASSNVSAILWAPNFKRTGYGFAGWNDKYDYSGNFYGPNETITTLSDMSNGLSLYAVWIKSAGSLQNWDGCGSLAQGATTALTDERDGNTYAVAKLADGKCWMIENLRLSDGPILSSENTHNPSLPFNNSWYYNESQSTLSTSNQLSSTTDPTQIAWCQSGSASCIDQSMVATNNTTLFIDNTASAYSAEGNVYSYGNYYNWYSATAGHGKYMSYSSGTHVPGDICPIGWRLPTGYSTNQDRGEINVLNNTINNGSTAVSNGLRSFPANFLFSGDIEGSSVSYRRTYGYYWTSTAQGSQSGAKVLSFSSGVVHPADAGTSGDESRYRGYPIRCLSSI